MLFIFYLFFRLFGQSASLPMADESYENLLDFFDSENSGGQGSEIKEDNHNIRPESNRVLSEIDNLLNESTSEKEDPVTVASRKRKAEDEFGEVEDEGDSLNLNTKSAKLESLDSIGEREVEDEVNDEVNDEDDALLDEEGPNDEDPADKSFEEMAALLDQCDEESVDLEGNEKRTEKPIYKAGQISQRLRELKQKYKAILQRVYSIYNDMPGMDFFPPDVVPMVSKGNSIDIAGFEELQEFVDSHHPLWKYDREAWAEMMKREDNRKYERQRNGEMMMRTSGYMMDEWTWNEYIQTERAQNETLKKENQSVLAGHIHRRWGNQDIDPRSSHTVLRDFKDKKENKREAKGSGVRPQTDRDHCQRTVTTIMEMDIDAIGEKLLERELARKSLFQSKAFQNVEPDNQRPHTSSQYSSENLLPCSVVTQMMKKKGQANNWTAKRTAQAVVGVKEAASHGSLHLGGDERMSEEQVGTILDIEEAYGKILELSHNNNEYLEPDILENL